MKKKNLEDKKKRIRETNHITRPPHLEGAIKNAMMYAKQKKKKRGDKKIVNDTLVL